MKSIKTKLAVCSVIVAAVAAQSQAQTPFYSVNGTGGTGGGTAGVSATPGTAPSGSTALTDLGATTQFSFGTGVDGTAGESIMNSATGQGGSGVLAGTLGGTTSYNQFTLTMWINLANTASLNNYRIMEISPGSPATTGTADGTQLFFGLNAGGGLQFYVNNNNPNTVGTDIAGANTWNNGGTLGGIAQNTWYFAAITYDSTANITLYSGSQSSSAISAATLSDVAGGALNLSSASSIALLNRFNTSGGGRNWPGAIDDANLYSGILSLSQIDAIQALEVAPVPEPGTMALAGMGSLAVLLAFRRRGN